ncbi:MAG: hypothetical protein IJK56_11005 [Firmicutes bacterium]|nr:hypothetical protein [Bacillota bacterium]
MNRPISLAIKGFRGKIVSAINESQLPPSLLEPILNAIYLQIAAAADNEAKQAEMQVAEQNEEVQTNG